MQRRLPPWLRKRLSPSRMAEDTDRLIKDLGLNTICQSGRCPNRNECYSQKTATLMIMGDRCTRNCHYCSVVPGKPLPLDSEEPEKVASAVSQLGLKHAVITSVTRDDLVDEGVEHFSRVVQSLHARNENLILEVLTPDFRRDQTAAVERFATLPIDIFNHNIECVRRLHRLARPQGGYELSLDLLRRMTAKATKMIIKSGAMLGIGETRQEVLEMMQDLREAGCQLLTLGQYLQSDAKGLAVERFVTPEEFEEYTRIGYNMGFLLVESGPFVRSSYHAEASFKKIQDIITEKMKV